MEANRWLSTSVGSVPQMFKTFEPISEVGQTGTPNFDLIEHRLFANASIVHTTPDLDRLANELFATGLWAPATGRRRKPHWWR